MYQYNEQIGKGINGIIWKVTYEKKEYALKIFQGDIDSSIKEVFMLKRLNHENIIKYEKIFYKDNRKIRLLLPLYEYDLFKIITKNIKINDFHILKCILQGLNFLHENGIIHRDIKTQNILISKDFNKVVISDFDSAIYKITNMDHYRCTNIYRAPELFLGMHEYNEKVDIWSFGCIIAEMVKRRPIFYCNENTNVKINDEAVLFKIFELLGTENIPIEMKKLPNWDDRFIKCKGNFDSRFVKIIDCIEYEILKSCFSYDPDKRPSCLEILKMLNVENKSGGNDDLGIPKMLEESKGDVSNIDVKVEVKDDDDDDEVDEDIQEFLSERNMLKYKDKIMKIHQKLPEDKKSEINYVMHIAYTMNLIWNDSREKFNDLDIDDSIMLEIATLDDFTF